MIDASAIRYRCEDREPVLRLMAELPQLSPLMAELLVGRGYLDTAAVQRFIRPGPEMLHDPYLLKDMERAVELLRDSMRQGLKILVHGDYDCDGICATVLLLDGLTELGADVDYHIPDRFEEGYGLSIRAVERAVEEGFGVLLSVDCGSSSHKEIEAAKQAGLRVIITDHHQVPDPMPTPDALVNPQRPDDGYPFKGLCGTGIAFKLLQALRGEQKQQPEHFLELVALATVADVVPLSEENRYLVQLGLAKLSCSERPGLRALLEAAGRDADGPVDSFTVGFTIAPRLNASGRLEHARVGVQLLRAASDPEARELAQHLHNLNEERKECEQRVSREIEERFAAEPWRCENGAIVEWGEDWHEGVIGITAGRLAEKYGCPTLVISVDPQKGRAKGSGRSPENVDLFCALKRCEELLTKFGGHPRAGGFSLPMERLEELRRRFTQATNDLRDGPAPVWIDGTLGLTQVTFELAQGLQRLEPFGEANPKPTFLLEGVTVVDKRSVGKNRDHLQLELEQAGKRLRAIAFRQGEELASLDPGATRYDVLCQLGTDTYQGLPQLRLQVTGIVRPFAGSEEFRNDSVVDLRNSRSRRSELESWLGEHPLAIAICRDIKKAAGVYPHLRDRFSTYEELSAPEELLVLLTPPSSEAVLVSTLEVCRPKRLVVLFGRQELDALDRSLASTFWGRNHAVSVWGELKVRKPEAVPRRELLEAIAGSQRLSLSTVEEIVEAFLETGALSQQPQTPYLVLASGSGKKLEETRSFLAVQERRRAHQRLLALFTGPNLSARFVERFPWLGVGQPVSV